MILLLIISISACIASSAQLECPACEVDCGDAGYLTCDRCQCGLSCDDWLCSRDQECVLEETTCVSPPCGKLPACIDFSSVCEVGSPLSTDQSTVLCDDEIIRCPFGYSCSKVLFHSVSVCCQYFDDDDDGPPPIIPNPPLVSPTRSKSDGCRECEVDLCEMTVCRTRPDARCVSVECRCESYYVDENGEPVDCVSDDDAATLPPFLFPNLDLPSPLQTSVQTPASTSETHPHKPPDNLGSRGPPSGYDDFTVHIIIGCITALMVIVIAVISYKIYRERRKPPATPDVEDQLKPLKMSNGEKPVV